MNVRLPPAALLSVLILFASSWHASIGVRPFFACCSLDGVIRQASLQKAVLRVMRFAESHIRHAAGHDHAELSFHQIRQLRSKIWIIWHGDIKRLRKVFLTINGQWPRDNTMMFWRYRDTGVCGRPCDVFSRLFAADVHKTRRGITDTNIDRRLFAEIDYLHFYDEIRRREFELSPNRGPPRTVGFFHSSTAVDQSNDHEYQAGDSGRGGQTRYPIEHYLYPYLASPKFAFVGVTLYFIGG